MYNQPGYDMKTPPNQQTVPPPYTQQPSAGPPQPSAGYPPQQPVGYPPQQPVGYPPQQPVGYPPQPVFPSSQSTNTTVVIQQQAAQIITQAPRGWSTGICSCFDDCGVCLLGWCCPCILQCTLSMNAGECCCVGACCPVALRTKIRTRHNIQGSIFGDACALGCCGVCAMCQMAREVNLHGI